MRNVHNLLSYGVVGKSVCRMWESCSLAFPCSVNGLFHNGIASYTHFHGACRLLFGSEYLIKSSSQSPAVMERWVLKVQALEEKKRHYEGVLQRELDGLDDEFSVLKLLSQELQVRANGIRNLRFQQRAA